MTGRFAAVDLGASSGRVILGQVSADGVRMEEVHRFRNGPVSLPDGLYWDILGLYQEVLIGLRAAGPVDGIGIDSWAVDYGLLDSDGRLLANPRHYRDPRTARGVETVHGLIDPVDLYAANGLQFLPLNSLYQFAAEPGLTGYRALLIPDLLAYWLTGVQVCEETNASTTGLLNVFTGQWDSSLIKALALPPTLLAPVVAAGSTIGPLLPRVRDEIGADSLVTAVGSHDTASAVIGVPSSTTNFAYISCGTWGLVGVELEAPVLTDASRAANFTNERGIDGTIRYLRNVMGLWLLSESVRTWQIHHQNISLDDALESAGRLPSGGPRIDPNDPVFVPPGDMPARIQEACRRTGQRVPGGVPEIVRCILDSLAVAFARAVDDAQSLSGRPVEVVHVVGGGSQNPLLCQLIADTGRRPVIAGPVEATAIGNLLVQARTHGSLDGDRWALRDVGRSTQGLVTYDPT